MNESVRRDLGWSAKAFTEQIWPQIRDYLGGGELLSVEEIQSSPFAKMFDILAGFDAIQVTPDGRVRGISSRVQQPPRNFMLRPPNRCWHPYNTFTIRESRASGATTEMEKRTRAIQDGSLYPAITVQGYVQDAAAGPWLTIGVSETRHLFEFIEDSANIHKWHKDEVTRNGAAKFIVIPWIQLGADRVRVFRNPEFYPPPDESTQTLF